MANGCTAALVTPVSLGCGKLGRPTQNPIFLHCFGRCRPNPSMTDTTIASFVVRFTQETPAADLPGAGWRGVVQHVQTSEQVRFTRIDDALRFIGEFVDLHNPLQSMGEEPVRE